MNRQQRGTGSWCILPARKQRHAQLARVCVCFCITFRSEPCQAQMSIIAIGDWGGKPTAPYYTPVEKGNADVMATVVDTVSPKPRLGLLMGDNFYWTGIDCSGDPDPDCRTDSSSTRFNRTFETVFDQPPLKDFPFYTILGNHDHYGNATAQRTLTCVTPILKYQLLAGLIADCRCCLQLSTPRRKWEPAGGTFQQSASMICITS